METKAPTSNISVRMPPHLLQWLRQQSEQSLRSMSAEVVWQLQRTQQASKQG